MNPPDVVDLSIFELFKNAHIVVKLVIIGLLLASIWSWAIILEKTLPLRQDEEGDRQVRAGVLVGAVAR